MLRQFVTSLHESVARTVQAPVNRGGDHRSTGSHIAKLSHDPILQQSRPQDHPAVSGVRAYGTEFLIEGGRACGSSGLSGSDDEPQTRGPGSRRRSGGSTPRPIPGGLLTEATVAQVPVGR